MPFDLIIRNATVLDGSGAAGFSADIAVSGHTIAEVGQLPQDVQATESIDAAGRVVCPGFIDIHTHADIALLARPEHLPKVMQGVTTEVFTNCGLGFAPVTDEALQIQRNYLLGLFGDDSGVEWKWRSVGEFLDCLESARPAANCCYLIPHGAVRVSVMGMEARPATRSERQRMSDMIHDGMDQGAWGLSTGLWYAPMCHADRAENVAVCRAAGFFATHQRDYGDSILSATDESIEIARQAGVPVQIAHLQMNGPANKGRAPELLDKLESARAAGVDVTCDSYPYTAGSTFVQSLLPTWATDGGPESILRRLADGEMRARIIDEMSGRDVAWSKYMLVGVESAANRALEGLTFDVAARTRGMRPEEWVCSVLEEDDLKACYVHHGAHEENVREVMQWPHQMIGSDGLHLHGKTHPRLYGTFPRVLGHYARDENVISLATAVHKMTGLPAARLGLKNRGLLKSGMAADMVIFDAASVHDSATFEDPLRYPTGIEWVFVNGTAVKRNGVATKERPGKVIRRSN